MRILPHLHCIRFRVLAVVAGLAAFSLPAMASLGGTVDTVEVDRAHMNASVSVTSNQNFEIHQIQAPEGTIVDEYVSPSGTVFAVAWRGHFMPDLQQILGSYFTQYSTALQSQPRQYGRHPLNIQQTGIVVQTSGQVRNYFGRVYVPSLLPQGFSPDQIQ